MLRNPDAKQIQKSPLSDYAEPILWKSFSRKLEGLGYHLQTETPLDEGVGSLYVMSRQDYSPPSFLPRSEQVELSSAVIALVYGSHRVGHILTTRPGVDHGVASDADVMGRYLVDRSRPFDFLLLRKNSWAVLATYSAIGFAAGVGIGELIYPHVQQMSNAERYAYDAAFGFVSAIISPGVRLWFEAKVRSPLLQMRAASQMDVSSYLFGTEAVDSIDKESRAQQFETAASLIHGELKSSGVNVDAETFYRAFSVIRDLGVDKAEAIAPVTRVPLERLVEIVRAHPGLLPAPVPFT